jgi:hypothetical protein
VSSKDYPTELPGAIKDAIIDEVKQRPILWNMNHPNYHKRFAQNQEFERVALIVSTQRLVLRRNNIVPSPTFPSQHNIIQS